MAGVRLFRLGYVDNDAPRNRYGRRLIAMALDEPTKGFMAFGIPRRTAKSMSHILRGDVTNMMCSTLPGVEHSSAPLSLGIAGMTLVPLLPDVVGDLNPLIDPARATAAALPMILLNAMAFELTSRAGTSRGMPSARHPRPSPSLAAVRLMLERQTGKSLAESIGSEQAQALRTMLGDLLRGLIDNVTDRERAGLAKEWAGWALLAAMDAMDGHAHVLPIPGRTTAPGSQAALAGIAFHLGRALIVQAALDVIDVAERERD